MKLNGQLLKEALTLVSSAANKSDVLIERTNGTVHVAATSLHHIVVASFADAGDDLKILIPDVHVRDLTKQIRKAATVEIEMVNATTASFEMGGKNKFTYAIGDALGTSVRRMMVNYSEEFIFESNGKVFSSTLNKVLNFAPKDAGDIRFRGAHILSTPDKKIEFMATDNQSIAIAAFKPSSLKGDFKSIIPGTFGSTLKLIGDKIKVGVRPGFLWFESNTTDKITSRVIIQTMYQDDQSTPLLPYQEKIVALFDNAELLGTLVIKKSDFAEVLDDIQPFTTSIYKEASFDLQPEKLICTSTTELNKGSVETGIISYEGKDRPLRLSVPALVKVIGAEPDDTVTFKFTSNRYVVKTTDGMSLYGSILLS